MTTQLHPVWLPCSSLGASSDAPTRPFKVIKKLLDQWFGQFRFWSSSSGLVELSENSALRAATIGQAKSTGYFMKLRDWPEFDLIRPAGANRLIVGSKTVRTIVLQLAEFCLDRDCLEQRISDVATICDPLWPNGARVERHPRVG